MARSSTGNRIERLEHIQSLLLSGEPTTVAGIAEELGVSPRTIARDIEVLRAQSVPIETDRGRGGGVRIHRDWGIGKMHLTSSEAVELLVSLAVAEQSQSPLFMSQLAKIRRKLIASFGPRLRPQVRQLKARILVGQAASSRVLDTFDTPKPTAIERLYQSFLLRAPIEIHYRDMQGQRTKRVIEPHYLMFASPVWYVLAWDRLRTQPRTFRCDRIDRAEALNDEALFQLKPAQKFMEGLEGVSRI